MQYARTAYVPSLDRLKHCNRLEDAEALAPIIEANIKKSVYPFASSFSAVYRRLTPTEVQVADLIKAGKTSKEIAGVLNISTRTVNFHRVNIRSSHSHSLSSSPPPTSFGKALILFFGDGIGRYYFMIRKFCYGNIN